MTISSKLAASAVGMGVTAKTGRAELGTLAEIGAEAAIDAVANEVRDFRKQRAMAWWTDYVRQLGRMSDEGAITEAHILQEGHPDFQERVHEALQAVWSALDVAVAPYLAFLAADYEARGAQVDIFYRRFARFLQDTTSQELECVAKLIAISEQWFAREGAPEVYAIACRDDTAATFSHSTSEGAHEAIEVGPLVSQVIRRLRDEMRLRDAPRNKPMKAGGVLDHAGITFERKEFERLKRFLAPPLV